MHSKQLFYRRTFAFISVIFLASSLAVMANPIENCTVVTKSGERFENVSCTVNSIYKTVTIIYEETKRNFSFTQIEAIFDEMGNNITPDLLEGHYTPTNETWKSERDEYIKTARQRLWKYGFRVGSNYSFLIGDYYEGFTSGVGFEGDFLIAVTHNIAIRATVSKSGMGWNDDYGMVSLDPDITILDQDYSVSGMRYLVGAQYYKRTDRKTPGKTIFYLNMGLGAIDHRLKAKLRLRDNTTAQIRDEEFHYSQTKFLTSFGGGIIFLMSNSIGLDMAASLDVVYVGTTDDADYSYYGSDVQTALIFDIKLALVFLFN